MTLTPVDDYPAGWWAKRDDMAAYAGPDEPSGAKVRQYAAMIAAAPPDAALMVGCSADGAMQIYVAHAAAKAGRTGIVVVPRRAERTAATAYAAEVGAEVVEVSPGYPSVYRRRVRDIAAERGLTVVRWDRRFAFFDTAEQVDNIPDGVRRVIVPTGTGLTAAGVARGLSDAGRDDVVVVAACVSPLATGDVVRSTIRKLGGDDVAVPLLVVEPTTPYGRGVVGSLPDGTRLDPWYAAKSLSIVQPGDVLWITGRRPERLFAE